MLVAPWCSTLICAFVCFTEGQMRQTGHSQRTPVTLTSQRGGAQKKVVTWPFGEIIKLLLSVKVGHHHKSPCKRCSRLRNQTLCSNYQVRFTTERNWKRTSGQAGCKRVDKYEPGSWQTVTFRLDGLCNKNSKFWVCLFYSQLAQQQSEHAVCSGEINKKTSLTRN